MGDTLVRCGCSNSEKRSIGWDFQFLKEALGAYDPGSSESWQFGFTHLGAWCYGVLCSIRSESALVEDEKVPLEPHFPGHM